MDTLNICVNILAFQDNDTFTKDAIYLQRWDFIAYSMSNSRVVERDLSSLGPLCLLFLQQLNWSNTFVQVFHWVEVRWRWLESWVCYLLVSWVCGVIEGITFGTFPFLWWCSMTRTRTKASSESSEHNFKKGSPKNFWVIFLQLGEVMGTWEWEHRLLVEKEGLLTFGALSVHEK